MKHVFDRLLCTRLAGSGSTDGGEEQQASASVTCSSACMMCCSHWVPVQYLLIVNAVV